MYMKIKECEEYVQTLKDKIEVLKSEVLVLKMVNEKYAELLKGTPGLKDK